MKEERIEFKCGLKREEWIEFKRNADWKEKNVLRLITVRIENKRMDWDLMEVQIEKRIMDWERLIKKMRIMKKGEKKGEISYRGNK